VYDLIARAETFLSKKNKGENKTSQEPNEKVEKYLPPVKRRETEEEF